MAFPRLLSLPSHVIGLCFVLGYVALDWISFVHSFGPFGITPWNPPTGLSFVLILLFGQRHLPLLFLAPLLAEVIVRGLPASLPVGLAVALIIGFGYSAATIVLLRPTLKFDVSLSSIRDLTMLLAIAVASAAVVAIVYVGMFASAGLVPWRDFGAAVLRYWVGDVIGIAVMTPFLLILLTRGRPFPVTLQTVLQIAAIGLGLVVVFASAQSRQFQLFYVLFLPIIWIAVRSGLEGVSAGLVLTQLGLIVALQIAPPSDVDVTAFQVLMLVLTMTGLATGMLVTERQRAEMQLRLQQEAQARLTRLGSMGQLASALAHEINQPLMAAGTYTRMVAAAIASGDTSAKAGEVAGKAVAQVERAAEVVRRLRDLIRLGRSELAPVTVARIIGETLELLRPEIDRSNVRIEQRPSAELPPVMADLLQVEQVLLNLVRNSIEAIRDTGQDRGLVTIEAAGVDGGFVEISVRDTGPGFTTSQTSQPLQPLASTKDEGLGVGLSLSQSIIEAHGGRLVFGNAAKGAIVRFTLPVAESQS